MNNQSTLDTSTLSFTGRIARWSALHRWWVAAATVLVVALAMFVSSTVEVKELEYVGEGEAARGVELIEARFDFDTAPTEQLVFSNPSLDVGDPAYEQTVTEVIAELRALPEVASVVNFYETRDRSLVSEDGHVVLARVEIDTSTGPADEKIGAIVDKVRAAGTSAAGFEMIMAGDTSVQAELERIDKEDFAFMIIATMVLALVFMLIAFRTVVAATTPIILAVIAIFTAIGIATLVSQVFPMVDFLAQVMLLFGMAVGVDYSLFIVSRYRSERKAGRSKLDAITYAGNTTGRAIFYAGITVVLSLAGLFFTNSAIFVSMSLGVIIVVLLALVGSLTLIPALLAILGDNINRLRLPIIGRESTDSGSGGIWGAIADKVLSRPGLFATVTAGALIALAVPIVTLDLGFPSGSKSLHDAVEGKRALQLLEENFSAGLAQPAIVVVDPSDGNVRTVEASVARLTTALEQDDAFITPFEVVVNPAGDLLFVRAPMVADANDEAAEKALNNLREDIIPASFGGVDAEVFVTGFTAASVDVTDQMNGSIPYVFAFVLGLALLLLVVMFRSVVIPFKAIALNLLSVGAAYGVMVLVFQQGWGIGLLGMETTGVISPWLPVFIFALLFGLSMDYHMLLLSRIKELHDQGLSNEESVSQGIKLTATQITSAAAVMVGVFAAFTLGRQIEIKQMGLGLAVAVLIDATLIRSVLLPASMKLLGDTNWYLPSWLEWLPKLSPEEDKPSAAQPAVGPGYGLPANVETVPVGGDD